MFEENEGKAGYLNVDIKYRTSTEEQKATAHISLWQASISYLTCVIFYLQTKFHLFQLCMCQYYYIFMYGGSKCSFDNKFSH